MLRGKLHAIGVLLVIFCCRELAGADAVKKPPVPDAAAVKAKTREVRSVLADAYSNSSKRELAEKLLSFGSQEHQDPVRRYVLFVEAGKAAIAAADPDLICRSVDAIALNYATMDQIAMRISALERAASVVTKESAEPLAQFLFKFSATVAARDDYDGAQRLLAAVEVVTRRYKNADLVRQTRERQKEYAKLQREFAKVHAALVKLNEDPTDKEANLTAGRYFALSKGNWDKGIPLLALGSDPGMQAAAALDLTRPGVADAQVALADKWWELGDATIGPPRDHLQERAGYWYQLAMPSIGSGFVKAKVATRLDTVRKAKELAAARAPKSPAAAYPWLEGEYQLTTQVLKSSDRDHKLGNVDTTRKLMLRAGGTGEEIRRTAHAGKWSVEENRLIFQYDEKNLGRATLDITRTKDRVTLNGKRVNDDGTLEWSWKATRAATRDM